MEADSSKSLIFEDRSPRREEAINSSPIKMIDEFESNNELDNADDIQIISMRENAARKQMNTNLELL